MIIYQLKSHWDLTWHSPERKYVIRGVGGVWKPFLSGVHSHDTLTFLLVLSPGLLFRVYRQILTSLQRPGHHFRREQIFYKLEVISKEVILSAGLRLQSRWWRTGSFLREVTSNNSRPILQISSIRLPLLTLFDQHPWQPLHPPRGCEQSN